MNSPKYCLDTHPLVWYFTGQKTLSKKAKKALDAIFSQEAKCFIPTIVILETFHLSLKKKQFIFPQFLNSLKLPNIKIISLDKTVLTHCFKLPKNIDIHDRVVAATSKVSSSALITKDKILQQTSGLKTL